MKYLLFEKSAIEYIISQREFQSIEYEIGKNFIKYIKNEVDDFKSFQLNTVKNKSGISFVGREMCNDILVFDLIQSGLLEKIVDDSDLLLTLQKTFRTAIKIWNRFPFSSSERVNETKSIVFPYIYTNKNRVVIERSPNCERLTKRGIKRPLLVYNYTDRDSHKDEQPNIDVLKDSGETYLNIIKDIRVTLASPSSTDDTSSTKPMFYTNTETQVSSGEFMYLDYIERIKKLTTTQKNVVENKNITSPIRIEGPAGTGKTASMILRAFSILSQKKRDNVPFKIIFFSHSETTNHENKNTFSYIPGANDFLSGEIEQSIEFTTLLNYCTTSINVENTQLIDTDATDAKKFQRVFIEDAIDSVVTKKYKTYKPLLSNAVNNLFDETATPKGTLISMLQHEFSVQIKGRTNCTIEEYYELSSIKNALVLETNKDKEFIFSIFKEYQNMLTASAVFDIDDITIEALAQFNAPIWRRERKDKGYDYIFVDEMHLFNINEQYCFHYLTKSPEQKDIPICFALDYSQAIGDRGNIQQDYIEKNFSNAEENKYKTIFRSSQQIADFCAAISASGALMFQSEYKNPYQTAMSGFTDIEEAMCNKPNLLMYNNDEEMVESLKTHIEKCKIDFHCGNSEIALISFEDSLINEEGVRKLSNNFGIPIVLINSRQSIGPQKNIKKDENVLHLFDPYNVNGLEFKCVILIGVDEGRVPQGSGVNDISENYIKYVAFNQLYLTSSRAKYRLLILGNKLHGVSSCLKYALENNLIELKEQ